MDVYWASTMYVVSRPIVVGTLLLLVLLSAAVSLGVSGLLHPGREG